MGERPITRVPLAPREVLGVLNLRGQVVAALDMRRRLGLEGEAEETMNVVLRGERAGVSLVVDQVGDVIDVSGEGVSAGVLEGPLGELVETVYRLPGRLLAVLSAERTVQVGGGR